jgi:hypothetical protein
VRPIYQFARKIGMLRTTSPPSFAMEMRA